MNKCIIFGCGNIGKTAYYKLVNFFDIVAYADNNAALWGSDLYGIQIISPKMLKTQCDMEDLNVIIAVAEYQSIHKQLREMSIKSLIVWKNGLLFQCGESDELYPMEYKNSLYWKKQKKGFGVLFVQTTPCIRTNKIAKALKNQGVEVGLAYTVASSQVNSTNYGDVYSYFYPIFTMESFLDFVNKSEIDIIHSSNEPDFLTVLLTQSNKPVVHDCHDLSSAYKSMTPDEMAVEYIANVGSSGVIYTTDDIRDAACRKFSLERKKTFVLDILISEEQLQNKVMELISFYKQCT